MNFLSIKYFYTLRELKHSVLMLIWLPTLMYMYIHISLYMPRYVNEQVIHLQYE